MAVFGFTQHECLVLFTNQTNFGRMWCPFAKSHYVVLHLGQSRKCHSFTLFRYIIQGQGWMRYYPRLVHFWWESACCRAYNFLCVPAWAIALAACVTHPSDTGLPVKIRSFCFGDKFLDDGLCDLTSYLGLCTHLTIIFFSSGLCLDS